MRNNLQFKFCVYNIEISRLNFIRSRLCTCNRFKFRVKSDNKIFWCCCLVIVFPPYEGDNSFKSNFILCLLRENFYVMPCHICQTNYKQLPAFLMTVGERVSASSIEMDGLRSAVNDYRYSQTARTAKMCQNVFNLL